MRRQKIILNTNPSKFKLKAKDGLVKKFICEISKVHKGHRFETVRKAAFTLGGMGKNEVLQEIIAAILTNNSFAGEENEFLKIADDCFKAGSQRPLTLP